MENEVENAEDDEEIEEEEIHFQEDLEEEEIACDLDSSFGPTGKFIRFIKQTQFLVCLFP